MTNQDKLQKMVPNFGHSNARLLQSSIPKQSSLKAVRPQRRTQTERVVVLDIGNSRTLI